MTEKRELVERVRAIVEAEAEWGQEDGMEEEGVFICDAPISDIIALCEADVARRLWEQADDPAVVEAVRASIYENSLRPAYVGAEAKETAYATAQIQKVLAALIGPRNGATNDN